MKMKKLIACILTVCLIACGIPLMAISSFAQTDVAVGTKYNAAKYLADEVFPTATRADIGDGSVWDYKLQSFTENGSSNGVYSSDATVAAEKGTVIKKPGAYSWYPGGSGTLGDINGVAYWDGSNTEGAFNASAVAVNSDASFVIMSTGGNWSSGHKDVTASLLFTAPATGKVTLSDINGYKMGADTEYLVTTSELANSENRLVAVYYDGAKIWPAEGDAQKLDVATPGVAFPKITDISVEKGKVLEVRLWRAEGNDAFLPMAMNPTVEYTYIASETPQNPGDDQGDDDTPDANTPNYKETYTATADIYNVLSKIKDEKVVWKDTGWRATNYFAWGEKDKVSEQPLDKLKNNYKNGGQTADKTASVAYGSGNENQGASVATDGKDFLVIKTRSNWECFNNRYELQFIAPKSGTIELTDLTEGGIIGDGEKYYKFGSYSVSDTACKISVTYDGKKIWPAQGDSVTIDKNKPYIEFPTLKLDVTTGKTLAIVMEPVGAGWHKLAVNPTVGYTKIVADPVSKEPEKPKYSATYLAREEIAKSIANKNQDDALWQMNASAVMAGWQYETFENGKLAFAAEKINGEEVKLMYDKNIGSGKNAAYVAPGAKSLYARVDCTWEGEFKTLDLVFNPPAAGNVVLHDPDGGNWGGGSAYPNLWSYDPSAGSKTRISIYLGEEKVWPEKADYVTLSSDNPFIKFPELTLYVTKFTPIRIHMEVEAGAYHVMGLNPAVSYLDGVAATGDTITPLTVGIIVALNVICPVIIVLCLPKKRRNDVTA